MKLEDLVKILTLLLDNGVSGSIETNIDYVSADIYSEDEKKLVAGISTRRYDVNLSDCHFDIKDVNTVSLEHLREPFVLSNSL